MGGDAAKKTVHALATGTLAHTASVQASSKMDVMGETAASGLGAFQGCKEQTY